MAIRNDFKKPRRCKCGRELKHKKSKMCGICNDKQKNKTEYVKNNALKAYKAAVLWMLRCTSPPATAEMFADSVNTVISRAKTCHRLGVKLEAPEPPPLLL